MPPWPTSLNRSAPDATSTTSTPRSPLALAVAIALPSGENDAKVHPSKLRSCSPVSTSHNRIIFLVNSHGDPRLKSLARRRISVGEKCTLSTGDQLIEFLFWNSPDVASHTITVPPMLAASRAPSTENDKDVTRSEPCQALGMRCSASPV